VPKPLIDQLKEGGMIIPVGSFEIRSFIFSKEEWPVARRAVLPVRFVPMLGSQRA
jgi:protein-L-isoaspartate O-methyltransferase